MGCPKLGALLSKCSKALADAVGALNQTYCAFLYHRVISRTLFGTGCFGEKISCISGKTGNYLIRW